MSEETGGVGERAAFETWYLGHFYMGDKQCGLEWLSTEPCGGYRHQHPAEQWIVWQARAALSPAREDARGADPVKAQLLENALRLSANRMDRLAIEFAHGSEMRWTVSEWAEESRAALSAPSHGGGVAHTDCRSEDGITVGLIDSIITSCRVLSSRDLTCEAAVEALRDLRSDSDVSLIKPSHGEQVREWIPVSERLPEPWTDVLAYGVNHRSHSYVVAGVFSGTWASQETEEATRFWPTHWMPLPAAPSAGSQKEQG